MASKRDGKKQGTSSPASRFDEAYFDKYYGDPKTRVVAAEDTREIVRAVCALARFWSLPLESALDLGAGVGHWRTALAEEAPGLKYQGVDISAAASKRYGHLRKDISGWRSREQYDLVVCQGVLQYLDDEAAERAIENIAAMSRGLFYLEALTKKDVAEVVDLSRSDVDVHLRTGAWYRSKLKPHFVTLGCGIFHSRKADGVFFELEMAGR